MQENLEAQNIYGDCTMEREAIECRELSKAGLVGIYFLT